MPDNLPRIFLDTNVYIVGVALPNSPEASILTWVKESRCEVVVSKDLIEQISRVARRLQGKDWSGEVLSQLWGLEIVFIFVNDQESREQAEAIGIPREDIELYLAAKFGKAQIFVSANHELVRAAAQKTGEFVSMTPEEFVLKYLN